MHDIFFILDPRDNASAWIAFKERYPHARLIDKNRFSYRFLSRISMTKMFWTVDSDVTVSEDWGFDFIPEPWDLGFLHIWPSHSHHDGTMNDITAHGTVRLWPSNVAADDEKIGADDLSDFKIKLMDHPICHDIPHDIFFIDNGDSPAFWREFVASHPRAIKLDNTKNVAETCSKISKTRMFYLVGSDIEPIGDWKFQYVAKKWDQDVVHTWNVRLPGDKEKSTNDGYHLALWPNTVKEFGITNDTKIKKMDDVVALIRQPDIFYVSDGGSDASYKGLQERFPDAKLVIGKDHFLNNCMSRSKTSMFYVIDSDVDLNEGCRLDYYPPLWDKKYTHFWPTLNKETGELISNPSWHGGVMMWSKSSVSRSFGSMIRKVSGVGNLKIMDHSLAHLRRYDIFMITYEEPNGEENWKNLCSRFPNAKRIHGIKGIHNAHLECAKMSETEMFWTIDGDTVIDDSWNFGYYPPAWDRNYLHLWTSRNPVNGLEYGYGSIKLWPRNSVLSHKGRWLDFTTTVGKIKMMDQVIATTFFNSSEYETWKSAFRESIKLLYNISKDAKDGESKKRLDTWLNVAIDGASHSDWSLKGAKDAETWFGANKNNLAFINDFSWLRSYYQSLYLNER